MTAPKIAQALLTRTDNRTCPLVPAGSISSPLWHYFTLPGPHKARPGFAPVCSPSFKTWTPFTNTCLYRADHRQAHDPGHPGRCDQGRDLGGDGPDHPHSAHAEQEPDRHLRLIRRRISQRRPAPPGAPPAVLPARFEPLTWWAGLCQEGNRPSRKKGFTVQMTPWERSGYRRGLRKAILKNQDAMFHALVHEHDSGLNS